MPLSPEEIQQRKNDRAVARRIKAKKPAARDPKTGLNLPVRVLPGQVNAARAPVVQENVNLLKPRADEKIHQDHLQNRTRYAAMKGHMEKAAALIAAGATTTQAAQSIGVSRRQIRKYMESGAFRERVQELQETIGNRIRGRVLKEVDRRTSPSMIKKMELLDLLRVGDRVGLGRGDNVAVQNNVTQTNYELTFAQVVVSDAGEESEDFPTYSPSDLSVSGGGAPE